MTADAVEARAAELAAARGCPPDCPACWAKAEWLVGATPVAPSRDSCVNGHQWADNTRFTGGKRYCKTCNLEAGRRYNARQRRRRSA